ncbi:GNAT family N-acetyltransferase [Pseudomonas sp. FBF18]|nr:GNAT family N-acetyltransferase [Pseudomonas sp. FBF18]
MHSGIEVRVARPEDAETIQSIYAPIVLNTAISFEEAVPNVAEICQRIAITPQTYPYLLAVQECSGLMIPDTHLGENARHREVSDDQATSYLYARVQTRSCQPSARPRLQSH